MIQQTSLIAFYGVPKRQAQVYREIIKLKGATNLMISRALGLPINSITGRTRDLVKAGLVYASGTCADPETKYQGIIWRATNANIY